MTPESPATGLTAQFGSLARALGAAAGIMEDDLEDLAERGLDHSAASLWLESRYITVTILSAGLAEAIANAILAMALPPTMIKSALGERLVPKWQSGIARAIGCAPFLPGALEVRLETLQRVRNSIVHAKPRVYSGEDIIHAGTADHWDVLTPENVRGFVELPLLLVAQVPPTSNLSFPIHSIGDDYWLHQAVIRGKGGTGRSPNAWRPHTQKARSKIVNAVPQHRKVAQDFSPSPAPGESEG